MIRIVENNDWVVFTVLGCAFVYALMFIILLKGIRLKDFYTLEFEEAPNSFIIWTVVSLVFCILASLLFSQYIPIVPKKISDLSILGLGLNKFGYTFLCVSGFYMIKTLLSYFFYLSIGNSKKWKIFYYTITKFFYSFSLILMVACLINYFFDIDKQKALPIYFLSLGIIFVFKIAFYTFHKNSILPEKWYYKILYICTLQIAPLLALWKALFY